MDRRQSIVDAARQSFSLYGYKATTMDHVAKIANVGKGTIYTFFSSKEELFEVIVQELIRNVKSLAMNALDPKKAFFENLHRALFAVLEYRQEEEILLRLTREVRDFGTPAATEGLKRIEEAILGFIKRQLELGMENGSILKCDAELVAFMIFKTYVALLLEWNHEERALTNEDIAMAFQRVFADGLNP